MFHGTICQVCDLDFAKRYGAIGEGFIEAHHLKAISTMTLPRILRCSVQIALEEGVAVHMRI
jgi:predicted HNH restriction endonuclease